MADLHLRVDRDGCLLDGAPRLLALNTAAGGRIGLPLVPPQLAMLARLARTLQMPVARQILVGADDADVSLRVEARPDGDAVILIAREWTVQPHRSSFQIVPLTPGPRAIVPPWRWRTDAALTLVQLEFDPVDPSGRSPADHVGRPLTRLVRLIEDDEGDLSLLTALAAGQDFVDQRCVRRDRPDVELQLSGRAIRSVDGRLIGYDGQAASLAPDPMPDLDQRFVERLSGALRGPLDRIVARASDIAAQGDGPLRRDYADYARDIASAGRHLLTLVDDLADLDAVERPDFHIDREPVDLADLARRAAGLLAVRAADRGIRIDRPDDDETLVARGDFHRILQILVNLIGNAVRYSPIGAMIWLRTEHEDDTAIVVVADQGKGIAPADQARIFEKFERVDPNEPGGSGLGLYISRRLARAMGGDITVDSAPGQGARFILTLPVR